MSILLNLKKNLLHWKNAHSWNNRIQKKKNNGVTGHVKKFKTNHGCSCTKKNCLVIAEFIPLITIKTRKHQNKCTVHPTALHVWIEFLTNAMVQLEAYSLHDDPSQKYSRLRCLLSVKGLVLFLFGLVWQYSSVQTKYDKGRFKVMATYLQQ